MAPVGLDFSLHAGNVVALEARTILAYVSLG